MFVKVYVFITNLSASESLLGLIMDDEQETYKMWKVASCEKVIWNESINMQVRKTVMQLCHDRGYLVTQVAAANITFDYEFLCLGRIGPDIGAVQGAVW